MKIEVKEAFASDGVAFQAVLTGSLSFSHIHDLAVQHGQAGWKAWLYPLSVDLLTVAAFRKIRAARRNPQVPTGVAWVAFLLGLAASLAANIVSSWHNPDRFVAVALGVWPAVAFLMCTLLEHDTRQRPRIDKRTRPQRAEREASKPVPTQEQTPAQDHKPEPQDTGREPEREARARATPADVERARQLVAQLRGSGSANAIAKRVNEILANERRGQLGESTIRKMVTSPEKQLAKAA